MADKPSNSDQVLSFIKDQLRKQIEVAAENMSKFSETPSHPDAHYWMGQYHLASTLTRQIYDEEKKKI